MIEIADGRVMTVKVIGFDFFGTLVKAEAEATICIGNACRKLLRHNINTSDEEFTQTYREVASEYRRVRNTTQREVSNRVWITSTLNRLGYDLEATSPPIVEAVEAYFDSWVLTVYDDAWEAILNLRESYRIGLISNFTDTSFLTDSLRALGLEEYFECVVVSEEVGWRKPHPRIFNRFLTLMNVEPGEVLFVGDDLERDIQGAKGVNMKTAWIVRTPNRQTIGETQIRPDYILRSLNELPGILRQP